nr:hypothetical protein [Tanacetum cinerariifolium]
QQPSSKPFNFLDFNQVSSEPFKALAISCCPLGFLEIAKLAKIHTNGQSFVEPPFEEEILAFIHFLGHSAAIRKLTNVNTNKLYQPWRTFAAIINKCLTGKSSGYDSLILSQAQILWGLYHKRNVDYAYLIWEDFVYQVKHKVSKKSNEMYYPRFTKVIIHHFMSKDPSIPRRNKVNWHHVRDDHMFSIIKLVSRHQNTQQFGALLPIELTNEEIRNSNAYKEYYAVATRAAPPKPKANEGTSSILRVPDVPTNESEKELSRNSTNEEGDDEGKDDNGDEGKDDGDDDDEDDNGEEGDDDDEQEVERDDDKDDEKEGGNDEQEYDEEEYNEETRDKASFDPIQKTLKNSDDESNGEEDLGLNVGREEGHDKEEEEDELYRDVNINQGRGIQATLEVEDTHVTLNPVNPDGMESIFETTSQMDVHTPTLENDVFLKTVDENMQKIIKEQVKEQVKKPPTLNRDWNKTLPAIYGSIQPRISELAKQTNSCSSFNELMDTPLDFSNFLTNRLKVDTLALKLLVAPTYELIKGSCKILVELEYHLEDVFKATTDQLDWVNVKGQQYPHNLLKPLPLIPNNRGRRVIPFEHFINNDLEYLRRGYDKHALWGVSYWGHKRQQFYGFAVNRESARDVYSKRKIIVVTKLKIVEWNNYKHLDWITRKEAYTAYSNPRGFIYQNKDKKKRLMRIDELHKFSDGTLTDVRTMLDDRLKGIQMKYLPQLIWRKSDKDRAAAMI